MYSFVDGQEDEFVNHLLEEQVDVPRFSLDEIEDVDDMPLYDEYYDDYDVDFLEQPAACSLSKNVHFQQCNESNQPTYQGYKEESIESTEGNSLPLCFYSFKLLKENSNIITKEKECVMMPNHTNSLEQTDKKLQQSSHVFDDPVTFYVGGIVCSKLQPLVEDESENEYVQQSKEIEKCAYKSSEENEEIFELDERTLPLCFASFKLLKENVFNVSNKKSYRNDVEYEERSGLANENCLPLCFSSFELLKVNHEITEEEMKFDCINNDIVLHEKIVINEEDQQHSHTFNDPVVDYIEGCFSSDLQPVINYQLGNKYDGKSTSVLDMDFFPLWFSFQPALSSDSEYCYFQQSQHIFQPFCGNQWVELHENKDEVEGVKHDCCFMHVLEDPFAVLLEAVNNPNVFNFLRLKFIDKVLNELMVNKIWRKLGK
jgi:hypothetical protein